MRYLVVRWLFHLSEKCICNSRSGKRPNGELVAQTPCTRGLPLGQSQARGNITSKMMLTNRSRTAPYFIFRAHLSNSKPTHKLRQMDRRKLAFQLVLPPFSGSPSPTHRYWPLKMFVNLVKSVSLALLLTFITTVDAHCTKPRVRREWRSLSEAERGDWLAAVKVGI